MHVRKQWEFRKIRKIGEKFYGKFTCFQYHEVEGIFSKLGLTVSKKFGNAVNRNLLKRRLRELFRHLNPSFKKTISINILPLRSSKKATFNNIKEDFENFVLHLNKGYTDDAQP